MSESLLVEHLGAVAKLTLNDPPFNRMSLNFMDELEQQVIEISSNAEIRAVLLTSAGEENFSVGMNLKQLPEGIERMGSAAAVIGFLVAGFFETNFYDSEVSMLLYFIMAFPFTVASKKRYRNSVLYSDL